MIILRFILLLFWGFALILPAFATSDDIARSVWSNEAMVTTYTYADKDILETQKSMAHYFTAQGWIAYSKALTESHLLESIKKNAYTVSSVALAPPKIMQLRDNYWQTVMPLMVMYKNSQIQQKQILKITMEFTKVPSNQGVRGYAITSLQAKVTQAPCVCPKDSTDDNIKNTR